MSLEWLGDALDAYTQIEVAKRSQPQLVQGIQQAQTPLARNTFSQIEENEEDDFFDKDNTVLLMGVGFVALGSFIFLMKKL